jgi:hypothetical protein
MADATSSNDGSRNEQAIVPDPSMKARRLARGQSSARVS